VDYPETERQFTPRMPPSKGRKLAEGVGFEPTVSLTPRSISSRVP
jgi:hypothetical protein